MRSIWCVGLLTLGLLVSCRGGNEAEPQPLDAVMTVELAQDSEVQIADYVVEIFEDGRGHLWFGTMGHGAARFDGTNLTYLSREQGLPNETVVSFAEDADGNLWFGTHSGVSKYDGHTFTNYTMRDGLPNQRVSNLLVDRAGTLWVGTWEGICRFDGQKFHAFALPKPAVSNPEYHVTGDWVTELVEDRDGNIWIGRDGYGACRFDGTSFTHWTRADGLPSNSVQVIRQDRDGALWFGCRVLERDHPDPESRSGPGGLVRFDGTSFTTYPDLAGLSENSIYSLYVDRSGHLWVGATGHGVYRFADGAVRLYTEREREDRTEGFGVQSVLEDRRGAHWFGFSGGLFRLEAGKFINVTRYGPWPRA